MATFHRHPIYTKWRFTLKRKPYLSLSQHFNPSSCSDWSSFSCRYCKDCEEWLCATCISAHQRVKVTKDHEILSTEQAARALKAAAKQRFLMCSKHPKEPLKFYCSKCSALTCRDCQLEDHQNHGDYLALVAAWEQQKPHLKILQERIAEKQAFIREYVASLEKCQEANSQVVDELIGSPRILFGSFKWRKRDLMEVFVYGT